MVLYARFSIAVFPSKNNSIVSTKTKTNRRYGTLKLENDLWTKRSTAVKMQRVFFEITIFL